jgi:uncharacterized RDD family membrane protein YckC
MMAQAPNPIVSLSRQGNYAGLASRGVAFGADLGALWGIYTLGVALAAAAWQLITGNSFNIGHHQVIEIVVLVVWWFVYFSYQWTVGGRTIGMALLGIRVVQKDGRPITGREAMLRAVLLYASFLFFVVAAIWILFQRERRTVHDLIARTAVVYAWDARAAKVRWLMHRGADQSKVIPQGGPEPTPRPTPAADFPK